MNMSFPVRDGVLVFCAAILAAPLWCVTSPAMPDYPAHLAGFFMIGGGAEHAPLSRYYQVVWTPVPNLASELIVPLLAKAMPLEIAAKLFMTAGVMMWVLGPAAIQRALFGRTNLTALAGAFFAYNANFTWGFFNYYFAAGLAFVLFAVWIATAETRNRAALAGFALAVLALYFCHLVAVFLLLLLIFCYALAKAEAEPRALLRRAIPIVLAFLPAALAYLFFKPAGVSGGVFAFDFDETLGDRLSAALQGSFDEPAYLLLGGLAILWLAGQLYGVLEIKREMRLCVIVLFLAAILAPEWALGGWGVHLRLPGVLGAILFASAKLKLPKRLSVAAGLVLFASLAANAVALGANWRVYDKQYGEFRAVLGALPPGTRLLTVIDGDALGTKPDQPYWHMAEYGIIDRAAFTPLMFATKGQHVIQVKPPYDRIAAMTAQQGSPPDLSELSDLAAGRGDADPDIDENYPYLKFFQCHFDVAVVVYGDGVEDDVPDFMTLRHDGSFFSLYDLHPTPDCAKR
jgi:hypothetical protein